MTKKSQNLIKTTIILIITVLLTGCSDSKEGNDNGKLLAEGKKLYDSTDFQMIIPKDWEVREQNGFNSDIPKTIQVAVLNNIKDEIFTASLNIAKDTLPKEVNTSDFTNIQINQNKNTLIEYTEISRENNLIQFQGKSSPTDPLVKFKQLFITKNKDAYTLTAAYKINEDEGIVIILDEMLNSFTLK